MGRTLLIVVIGFSSIFTTLILQVTSNQQVSSRAIVRQYERQIAENALESVTNVANSKLYQDFSWSTGYSGLQFGGAVYNVDVTNITGDSVNNAEKDSLNIRVSYESIQDTCVTILIRPAYSYFQILLQNWVNTLEFDTGDTLWGPIHSNNNQIRMDHNPVFMGKVSSAETNWFHVSGLDNPRFNGGVEFGTKVIGMDAAILTPLRLEATTFIPPTHHQDIVALYIDFIGTQYQLYTDATYTTPSGGPLNLADANGIIYSTTTIHVRGVVDGQITVLSDDRVWIEDDIVCASDPSVNPASDDYIGLIAQHQVWIADNVANQTDVIIHAAILSQHDELDVQHISGISPRGTLTLVGSLVAQDYVNNIATDYTFNHVYDGRLRDKTPPYYPRTTRVEEIYRSK